MSTRETPPAPEAWADEAPTERTETPLGASVLLERTSRERCLRCGGRAAARCVGCGEAFCRACVDPISASMPDVRCRRCALRIGDGPPQGSPLLLEQILVRCLGRLSATAPSPLVHAMRKEALECQGEIDSWRTTLPPAGVRGAMCERVLALHAKIDGQGR
jgi:hypothetical protein